MYDPSNSSAFVSSHSPAFTHSKSFQPPAHSLSSLSQLARSLNISRYGILQFCSERIGMKQCNVSYGYVGEHLFVRGWLVVGHRGRSFLPSFLPSFVPSFVVPSFAAHLTPRTSSSVCTSGDSTQTQVPSFLACLLTYVHPCCSLTVFGVWRRHLLQQLLLLWLLLLLLLLLAHTFGVDTWHGIYVNAAPLDIHACCRVWSPRVWMPCVFVCVGLSIVGVSVCLFGVGLPVGSRRGRQCLRSSSFVTVRIFGAAPRPPRVEGKAGAG